MPIQLLAGIYPPNAEQQSSAQVKIIRNLSESSWTMSTNIHDTKPGKRRQCSPLVVCLLLLQKKWGYHLCTYNGVKTATQLINNHSIATHRRHRP